MKLFGMIMLVICGTLLGANAAENCKRPIKALSRAERLCAKLMIMLEYEAPTVEDMLKRLKDSSSDGLIVFSRGYPTREELLEAIEANEDGFYKADMRRLKELFISLGSADKDCELARTASAREYFLSREKETAPKAKHDERLYRSLGTLGGIFAAVMLM